MKSKRLQAVERTRDIYDAIQEHMGEADRDGNSVWLDALLRFSDALRPYRYGEKVPDKFGRVNVTLEM